MGEHEMLEEIAYGEGAWHMIEDGGLNPAVLNGDAKAEAERAISAYETFRSACDDLTAVATSILDAG